MNTFLSNILKHKEHELHARKAQNPISSLQIAWEKEQTHREKSGKTTPSLFTALKNPQQGDIAIIAEIKRASPSAGVIKSDTTPHTQAENYLAGGADAISVLTDEHFFHGTLADLEQVNTHITIPTLRKDFIIDEYQVYEAALAGAAGILLIVAALTPDKLASLLKKSKELNLDCLVEIHTEEELNQAIAANASIIGINARDLKTFTIDLAIVETLAPRIAKESKNHSPIIVAESGISTRQDIDRIKAVGCHAALVGTALMQHPNPTTLLHKLKGIPTP